MDKPLDEVINDSALLDEPYVKDEAKANAYMQTLFVLDDLQAKGKLTFTADLVSKPLYLHGIQIHWNVNEFDIVEISASEIGKALLSADNLCYSVDIHPEIWDVTVQIYRPA